MAPRAEEKAAAADFYSMEWQRKFSLRELQEDDAQLVALCDALEKYGAALVSTEGFSAKEADWADGEGNAMATCPLVVLTDMLGFRTFCGYGEFYRVHQKPPELNNNASYTAGPLSLHTDLPDSRTPPEVQYLYFHKTPKDGESDGGASLLCDGRFVAEEIRSESPEAFRLLSETKVRYCDLYTDRITPTSPQVTYLYEYSHPVIGLDRTGSVVQIAHSDAHRAREWGGQSKAPCDENSLTGFTGDFKQAFALWQAKIEEHTVQFHMKATDILVFDNLRMLHGRTAYEARAERALIGTYTRWDEVSAVRKAKQLKLAGQI